ncbi:MAG: plasmid mobilization relaxosome protein MobC [Alphaproteobacteria bacterium]|nr:plasmid mobilization relaxosome protein MobC [Alphaproteobacteria bacterium]QQS57648.1 MAG: plasmid mobilization relaxosome protein MobC [Alphaproteobacteria bacterium]
MPQNNRHRRCTISLRLTEEERAQIAQKAGSLTLSDFIRQTMLLVPCPRKHRLKAPIKDHKPLAQILALLGASRMASNLNQIARGLNTGSLIVSVETEEMIKEACTAILQMRDLLIQALGLSSGGRS